MYFGRPLTMIRFERQDKPREVEVLVGAVGIENNTIWSFKDLEEMLRSAKTLNRNNEESSGILIGPSMAPRFS
jgi:hypothetical protein